MTNYPNKTNPGAFVPTTYVWDMARLQDVDVTSQEFKELLLRLYININQMALSLNISDKGYYVLTEFVNGQAYFEDPALNSLSSQTPVLRQVFRKVINFGALPNTGTTSVAHGIDITSSFSFTSIYATSSDQVALTFIPIPYASPVAANNIELSVDATNVNITTGSNRTNYTVCYVVLEYIKQ